MYAGGLAADNNIPFLLECCKDISELDEVWICGTGPDEEKVAELAVADSRIKYFGRLSNAEVLRLEEQAKILVNFRSPDVELTKYSFPSKILEYISAGSLVLSTRLIGIPEEYFSYIVTVDLKNKADIIGMISQLLTMPDDEYIGKCLKAQEFIMTKKNYLYQSKRIIAFVSQI